MEFDIEKLENQEDIRECAKMMASMEPFITLKRDYPKLLDILNHPLSERYMAEKDGEILGCAVLRMQGALLGYVQLMAIRPRWQGKGIGGKFLSMLEKRIFTEYPNVFVCCSSFNNAALGFYKHMGFEVIGELKDYLLKGYSEYILRKTTGPINEFIPSKP